MWLHERLIQRITVREQQMKRKNRYKTAIGGIEKEEIRVQAASCIRIFI